MTTKTMYRWEQDGAGGDHGTLVLWPGSHREQRLIVTDFSTAYDLGMKIENATREAFERGRRSILDEIARIRP